MTIAPVQSSSAVGGPSGGTTPPIDTSGANLLVVVATGLSYTATDIVDSYGNTYQQAVAGGSPILGLFYCLNPTAVGGGHTVQISKASSFSVFSLQSYSGVGTYDKGLAGGNSLAFTPTGDGELVITAATGSGTYDGTPAPTGFALDAHKAGVNSVNFGYGVAHQIQTTKTAVAPTWPAGASETIVGAFTAAAAGGSTASLATTEAADTTSVSAAITASASLAATEAADTANFTTGGVSTASMAATEAGDTTSIAASASARATLSASEGQDTVAVNITASATLAVNTTESADQAAFAAAASAAASLAASEAGDVMSFRTMVGTFNFPAHENVVVAAENRAITIQIEDRTITIPSETRSASSGA